MVLAEQLVNGPEHLPGRPRMVLELHLLGQGDSSLQFGKRTALLCLLPYLPVHILKNQGNAQHNAALRLGKVGLNVLQAFADHHRGTLVKTGHHGAAHFVSVVNRQYRQHPTTIRNTEELGHVVHVLCQVPMGKHYALGQAGGAGGKQNRGQIVRVYFRLLVLAVTFPKFSFTHFDQFGLKQNSGILSVLGIILFRRIRNYQIPKGLHRIQARNQRIHHLRGDEQQLHIGAAQQVLNFSNLEALVDRNDDAHTCHNGKIRKRPAMGVLSGHRNLAVLEAHAEKRSSQRPALHVKFLISDGLERILMHVLVHVGRAVRIFRHRVFNNFLQCLHIRPFIINAVILLVVHILSLYPSVRR